MVLRSLVSTKVAILLARRGMNASALARELKVVPQAISQLLSGKHTYRPLRRKVEKFFGEPIWSDQTEFEHANHLEKVTGIDLFGCSLQELRRHAKEKAGSVVRKMTRPELYGELVAQAATREITK